MMKKLDFARPLKFEVEGKVIDFDMFKKVYKIACTESANDFKANRNLMTQNRRAAFDHQD